MKHKKVKIGKLAANPFRHIERYPIRADKVAALRESIRKTGWWGNVVAREVGGRVELAYGHHRLEAAKKELGSNAEVEVIIRDLDDESMLQIMARENMEEWGSSSVVEQETVRAVVEAYAEEQIELPAVDPKVNTSRLRYAPGFIQGGATDARREHPYTAGIIADFLGWSEDKVQNILASLEAIERGALREEDFAGLGSHQAKQLTRSVRAVERGAQKATGDPTVARREARATAKKLSREMRQETIAAADAPRHARQAVEKKYPKIRTVDAEGVANKAMSLIHRSILADERLAEARKVLPEHLTEITKPTRRDLSTTCRRAAEWLWAFADDLGVPVESTSPKQIGRGGAR